MSLQAEWICSLKPSTCGASADDRPTFMVLSVECREPMCPVNLQLSSYGSDISRGCHSQSACVCASTRDCCLPIPHLRLLVCSSVSLGFWASSSRCEDSCGRRPHNSRQETQIAARRQSAMTIRAITPPSMMNFRWVACLIFCAS